MFTEFKNEPYLDFSLEENRRKMKEAIEAVKAKYNSERELIIAGKRIKLDRKFNSINPSDKDKVIGVFQKGDEKAAEMAVEAALKAFQSWRFYKAESRAAILIKLAELMRKNRFELDALMILETGKNWLEADADLAEAIDFCEFYAREAVRYGAPQPITPYPGELPELRYIPLGVGVVIPPWNFPSAILTGMTTAAIVTGNTVVLKPASTAPAIATRIVELMEEAGLPPGVVNLLTGPGAIAGDYLVKHPKIRFITFTGSMEVGLGINEKAAITQPGQIWIKRTILEMGGKDCIIVDEEADIDAAVSGVLVSAFGYQGQKCSACSRLILHRKIFDQFIEKFLPKVDAITVGPVEDFNNFMGPVIDENAYNKILEYIEIGKREGKLVAGGEPAPGNGYFIKPTVFTEIKPHARLAQEEIFGPVLSVIRADDFDQALEIANNTIYGLTGSVYTRNREKIEKAKDHFFVGNMYINRKCTGALVGVHPFGGFNMSGTDSKAGGRDYLLLFLQAKSISEKI